MCLNIWYNNMCLHIWYNHDNHAQRNRFNRRFMLLCAARVETINALLKINGACDELHIFLSSLMSIMWKELPCHEIIMFYSSALENSFQCFYGCDPLESPFSTVPYQRLVNLLDTMKRKYHKCYDVFPLDPMWRSILETALWWRHDSYHRLSSQGGRWNPWVESRHTAYGI